MSEFDFIGQLRKELKIADSPVASASQESKAMSVSQLTSQIKNVVEGNFGSIWVEGELSNVSKPSSGHCYATLKDSSSQIQIVIFKSVMSKLKFHFKEGMEVAIRGHVTIYPQRGNYQIIVRSLEPKGLGSLQLAFEQLKEKLYKEGLFDESNKKSLPFLPQRIGVVTSFTGAAIKDFVNGVKRRCPISDIVLIPVKVQGEGAGLEISSAIQKFNVLKNVDVIVVGRGGGSLEDLWAFNEEIVARSIFHSEIPIISAVGHEIDVSISDYVADKRAITPTQAAEICVPDLQVIKNEIRIKSKLLNDLIRDKFEFIKRNLLHITRALSPRAFIKRIEMSLVHLDNLEIRLKKGLINKKDGLIYRVNSVHDRFQSVKNLLEFRFKKNASDIKKIEVELNKEMKRALLNKRKTLENYAKGLELLSPLKIMGRGYSFSADEKGKIVKDVGMLKVGQLIKTKVHNGSFTSEIREIINGDN